MDLTPLGRAVPGAELAHAVVAHALAFPELHDQEYYMLGDMTAIRTPVDLDRVVDESADGGCGTVACLAGWTVVRATPDGTRPQVALRHDTWANYAITALGYGLSAAADALRDVFGTFDAADAIREFARVTGVDLDAATADARRLRAEFDARTAPGSTR